VRRHGRRFVRAEAQLPHSKTRRRFGLSARAATRLPPVNLCRHLLGKYSASV
jgi:hypothetical protein